MALEDRMIKVVKEPLVAVEAAEAKVSLLEKVDLKVMLIMAKMQAPMEV